MLHACSWQQPGRFVLTGKDGTAACLLVAVLLQIDRSISGSELDNQMIKMLREQMLLSGINYISLSGQLSCISAHASSFFLQTDEHML